MTFKIGDTVKLKSGGPEMTIATVQSNGDFWCIWFNRVDAAWETKGHAFKVDTLKSLA